MVRYLPPRSRPGGLAVTDRLEQLAERYGIAEGYHSEEGTWVATRPAIKAKVLAAMGVPAQTASEIATSLAAAPAASPADGPVDLAQSGFWPLFLVDHRVFGFALQLYGVRSARNWGIGDFEDLARLAEYAAGLGADFIGVNPLHALFPADPARISPYAPSSRAFLNPLYIAPDRVPGFAELADREALIAELAALRGTELVDYLPVHRVKFRALEALFAHFTEAATAEIKAAFARYCREQGEALANHALYEALAEHFVAEGGAVAWMTWPAAYHDPDGLAVRDFARAARRRIAFFQWLQWIADTQLADAQRRAKAAGMRIGLYLDLAVGVSPDGATSWSEGRAVARAARIGCPPDPFSTEGQDWGLVPFSPLGLEAERYEPFRALLRANMCHAGALRLDHAMGLQRLYWIPEGERARDGAYVRYPFRALLEAVAEESSVFRTIVIGEDLGTVPPGFTDTIVRAGLLSYQVLYFGRSQKRFQPPEDYRREALVCVSTHDLPTLKGWWAGTDIDWRVRTGRATKAEAEVQRRDRMRERKELIDVLAETGLLPAPAAAHARTAATLSDAAVIAVHRFLALTPSRLFAVQFDDALGTVEQANLPGTVDEHPNWRHKMAVRIEELRDHALFRAVTAAVAAERPRA
jgi:4-alpha-glucanotransferase